MDLAVSLLQSSPSSPPSPSSSPSLLSVLHPSEEAKALKVVRGQRLSGKVEEDLTRAEVAFEVRVTTGEEGRVVGLYKVKVTATARKEGEKEDGGAAQTRRGGEEGKEKGKEGRTRAVVTVSPSPLPSSQWVVEELMVSSPSRQLSFLYHPLTATWTRSPVFLPIGSSSSSSASPPSQVQSAQAVSPSSSSASTSSSSPSSSSPSDWSLQRYVVVSLCCVLVLSISAEAFRRYRRRQSILRQLSSSVEAALKSLPSSQAQSLRAIIGSNPRLTRTIDSHFGSALLKATFQVEGDQRPLLPHTAPPSDNAQTKATPTPPPSPSPSSSIAQVSIQAVKQRRQRGGDGKAQEWRLVFAELTGRAGYHLSLPIRA